MSVGAINKKPPIIGIIEAAVQVADLVRLVVCNQEVEGEEGEAAHRRERMMMMMMTMKMTILIRGRAGLQVEREGKLVHYM